MDKIQSKHKLSYCDHCESKMVVCATCGNNCCNGGSGEINGVECLDCLEAYKHQDLFFEGVVAIEFSEV